jgi:sulfatase modifying factor 1
VTWLAQHAVDTHKSNQWTFKFGANWKRPYGPRSSISGLPDHPVVPITSGDALAYAKWAGKDLWAEADWEFAACGGLDGTEFAWGDDLSPVGRQMANAWQGVFPRGNPKLDGYERTLPVTAPPLRTTMASAT